MLLKNGPKSITIAGCLMCFVGLIISSICNRFLLICLTFGIMTGMGIGSQIVSTYFSINYGIRQQYKDSARVFSLCGLFLGPIIFLPLQVSYLIKII